jgi:hypothetical protein
MYKYNTFNILISKMWKEKIKDIRFPECVGEKAEKKTKLLKTYTKAIVVF